jgi:hypothetical protein
MVTRQEKPKPDVFGTMDSDDLATWSSLPDIDESRAPEVEFPLYRGDELLGSVRLTYGEYMGGWAVQMTSSDPAKKLRVGPRTTCATCEAPLDFEHSHFSPYCGKCEDD